MKKKIIFVTKALWIGGIETALVNLLNHFNYDKYEVTLLVLHAELDMAQQINPKCRLLVIDREKTITFETKYRYNKLYHLTEETEHPSRLHRVMMWIVPAIKWVENHLYIRYIRELMQGEQFDTAIIYSDVVAEMTIRAINADKYLMFYHHGAMRHVYHDKIAYKKCDKIIAVSKHQADELKKFVPQFSKKITVIHNLTDVDGIKKKGNLPCDDVFDSTKINIVSVGRVSHEKGMDIAVRVCSKLVENGYEDVRWWIVGNGPAMEEVRETVEQYHMEDYVILVGMKNNPYPYIKQADLYVQPSRFEGNPMTILESLILGQPVVSTDNNGAKEILQDGVTGLLRPMETDALSEAIISLLNRGCILEILKNNVRKSDFEKQNMQNVSMLEKILC